MARKLKSIGLITAFSLTLIILLAVSLQAQAAPAANWPSLSITQVATGLVDPLQVTHAGDGSGRLFIVEQIGRIRIFTNSLLSQPFLDIRDRVTYGGEQGLLGLAFPPNYSSKGYFYVYYTDKSGNNVVSRFYLGHSANQADPASEEKILPLAHPTYGNHNGGQLAFGPDGYLYIGTGDGGGGGDPNKNAQNPASVLGKILRIDVEQTPSPSVMGAHVLFLPVLSSDSGSPSLLGPYAIPPDNPFVGQAGYRPEIWALGMRNPWRFSFDRQTGDLYIGDVGQDSREEIDFQLASSSGGENYGWNCWEGNLPYQPGNCDPSAVLTAPVHTYATDINGTCAVIGGYVYRGPTYESMQGIYFFSDYCQGVIKGLQQDAGSWVVQDLLPSGLFILGFGEDEQGELYLAAVDPNAPAPTGQVFKITTSP